MENSMCKIDEDKLAEPYLELFENGGTQVYLNDEQVFDVLAAASFSKNDRTNNPEWIDFVKFNNGDVKTGHVKIVVQGIPGYCSVSVLDSVPSNIGYLSRSGSESV